MIPALTMKGRRHEDTSRARTRGCLGRVGGWAGRRARGWRAGERGANLAQLAGTAAQQEDQVDDLHLRHSKPAANVCGSRGTLVFEAACQ